MVIVLLEVHSAIVVRAHWSTIDLFVLKINLLSQSLTVLQIWDGSDRFLNAFVFKGSYGSRWKKRSEKEVISGRD